MGEQTRPRCSVRRPGKIGLRLILQSLLFATVHLLWQAPATGLVDRVTDLPVPTEIDAQVRAGDFTGAETQLRALLRAHPDGGAANFLLGYVLYREHRYTDSLSAYTEGAQQRTPGADDLVIVASDYIQLRSYADAERWLTHATAQSAQNATAWYLLGRTEYLLDRPEKALPAFEQCLRIDARDVRAKYNAGLALERLQRPEDAEAAYRQAVAWALEQHSSDPQPWLNLGMLLLTQGRIQDAVQVLSTAIAKAPQNALCQQQLGTALEAAGRHADAVLALRRAVALAPNAERAHFYLGRAYKALGQKAEADAEFATVARLYTTHQGTETPNPDVAVAPMSVPPKVLERAPEKD